MEFIDDNEKHLFDEILRFDNSGYNNRYNHGNNLRNTLKPLRGKNCIYFLLDDNSIVYIGKTINPYDRIIFHRHNKDFKYYIIGILKDGYRINAEETSLIRKYKPFYNLTDKINFRELKKVNLWLNRNQYEKLEILSKKENIKKIQLLQNIINKKIKP